MRSTSFATHVALPGLFVCALVALSLVASPASAQVIYEPVQYQYKAGGQYYYYGGDDPRIHAYAHTPQGGAGRWGRVNGYAFAAATIDTSRYVTDEPIRVFTDALPYINAHIYGFTVTDARNEAYFNVPRYFRKADLLNAAIPVDGVFVVPAQAQPIRIDRNGNGAARPGATTEPKPILIIPKDRLHKPEPQSDKTYAALKR